MLLLMLYVAPYGAVAQQIPAKGTDATLDVATWNIEWFGDEGENRGPANDAGQQANVQAVVEQADIDLWGVQEISDPQDFDALLDALGDGYDGVLATQSGTQRIGFIYKTNVIHVRTVRHILENLRASNGATLFAGRPPLQLEADVMLPDTTFVVTFIVLHMKCCGDGDSYTRRLEAGQRLKNRIDLLYADDPIIVLGDFNDELGFSITSGRVSPYLNFVDDAAQYAFLTLPLDQRNEATYCGNSSLCTSGSTLDHILITDELMPVYETDSAARFEELVTSISGYVDTTSDHLPVFARFRFDTQTAVEAEEAPEAIIVEPAYPNPFVQRTTLTYTLPRAAAVRVEALDLLGRRVRLLVDGFQSAGAHRVTFDAGALPPGMYVIRFSADSFVDLQRVVRVR